jgi:hypothetical protein
MRIPDSHLTKRLSLRAVHDSDLREFLVSLGILDQVSQGVYSCAMCGIQIGIDNFGAIYPERGEICFVCDRTSCLAKLKVEEDDEDVGSI